MISRDFSNNCRLLSLIKALIFLNLWGFGISSQALKISKPENLNNPTLVNRTLKVIMEKELLGNYLMKQKSLMKTSVRIENVTEDKIMVATQKGMKEYYHPGFIPGNFEGEMSSGEEIIIYTLFNVVHFVEKSSLPGVFVNLSDMTEILSYGSLAEREIKMKACETADKEVTLIADFSGRFEDLVINRIPGTGTGNEFSRFSKDHEKWSVSKGEIQFTDRDNLSRDSFYKYWISDSKGEVVSTSVYIYVDSNYKANLVIHDTTELTAKVLDDRFFKIKEKTYKTSFNAIIGDKKQFGNLIEIYPDTYSLELRYFYINLETNDLYTQLERDSHVYISDLERLRMCDAILKKAAQKALMINDNSAKGPINETIIKKDSNIKLFIPKRYLEELK